MTQIAQMKIKTYKYLGLGLVIGGLLVITVLIFSQNLIRTYYSSPSYVYDGQNIIFDNHQRWQTPDQMYAMFRFMASVGFSAIGALLAGLVVLLVYFRKKRNAVEPRMNSAETAIANTNKH